jgi:hypothetical protein
MTERAPRPRPLIPAPIRARRRHSTRAGRSIFRRPKRGAAPIVIWPQLATLKGNQSILGRAAAG